MSEVKKLFDQIRVFVESSAPQFLNETYDKLVGNEIQNRIEHKKNSETVKFLKNEILRDEKMRHLNEYLIAALRFGEKKIAHQRISDFNAALEEVVSEKMTESDDIADLLKDFKNLIEEPLELLDEVLRLEEENSALEERLSKYASMPCFEETAYIAGISELTPLLKQTEVESQNIEHSLSEENQGANPAEVKKSPSCLRITGNSEWAL